ncbi:MAG TPA: LLM class flavin-dependent oxidoreductase [Thermoleophilaceae bacterium]|nr:LLM class flavin-dependent oxidoreductase [Thermoleophilaceae bacterium]
MDFAIGIPQYVGDDGFDGAAFRAHLARAEDLGFHSAWVQEQTLGTARTLSPLGAMTYAAACTERLRLGCAVFVTPLHNALHLAKEIATLDNLSHGRIEVGLAAGGRARPFAAFGVDPDRPVARFNEGLELMKACWSEPRITLAGDFWQLDDAAMEPKPVQRPHPPIWIGGNHPNALRRAARLGNGFFGAGSQTTAAFAEQVRGVRAELERLDRDPAGFRFAKRVYVRVDDDGARARERLEAVLASHYGRPGWDAVVVTGPPSACIDGLRAVADAGAEMILLNPLVDDLQQMERLAAEVIPPLR